MAHQPTNRHQRPAPGRSIPQSEERSRQPDASRSLRLGVDYGTSRSKLVITDYDAVDGDRSFLVRPASSTDSDDYLIPSTVCATEGSLRFGFSAEARADEGTPYRSLKMLCAYPDRFYGDRAPLPTGMNARDLATLYVGHLITLGRQAAKQYAAQRDSTALLSITLGAPMAQLDDEKLHTMFVGIAREAFALAGQLDLQDTVSIADARGALKSVRAKVGQEPPPSPRDWVRSEAEAALFWAHRSPDIAGGRYACIDVGAGTTSASWFHISAVKSGEVLVNERLSFYSAACAPPACDAVDRVLATHVQDVDTLAGIRGRENELLQSFPDQGRAELDKVLAEIAKVFGEASGKAFPKDKSILRWRGIGRVFFLGGGTKLDVVQHRLLQEKADWLKSESVANPGLPSDLFEQDGSDLRADPAFLLVAYGLARRLGDVPDVFAPGQIDPYTPKYRVRDRVSSDDLYSD